MLFGRNFRKTGIGKTGKDSAENYKSDTKAALARVSPSFCLAKWLQVTIHLQNGLTHSCHHPRPHKIDLSEIQRNPSALHNTQTKKRCREQMLEGVRPPECVHCWKIEDSAPNATSDRHLKSSNHWAWPFLNQIAKSDPRQDINPTYLEVSFSNACNFKCSYCAPTSSSRWVQEIRENGPIGPDGLHSLEALAQEGMLPLDPDQTNPYAEAFWKWWPEVIGSLKVFRITGGEPLMSPDTYRVIQDLSERRLPLLEFGINSNLGVSEAAVQRMITGVRRLIDEKRIKSFFLFTSLDTYGPAAEYIRHGLDLELFERNLHASLSGLPETRLTFMCTFGALSVPSFPRYLEWLLVLKQRYPGQVVLDISYLREPSFMSMRILPRDLRRVLEDSMKFMESHPQEFKMFERSKMDQALRWFDTPLSEPELKKLRAGFHQFFKEHDRRRNTCFTEAIPQLKGFYEDCAAE